MSEIQVTLHRAVQAVLVEIPQQTGTTEAVCAEIIRLGLYKQKTGGNPHAGQIRIRGIKYPALFEFIDRNTIHLRVDRLSEPRNPDERPGYRGEEGGPCPKRDAATVGRQSRTTGELYFGCTRPKKGATGGCNLKGCRSH